MMSSNTSNFLETDLAFTLRPEVLEVFLDKIKVCLEKPIEELFTANKLFDRTLGKLFYGGFLDRDKILEEIRDRFKESTGIDVSEKIEINSIDHLVIMFIMDL